jgi:hypothetical protein
LVLFSRLATISPFVSVSCVVALTWIGAPAIGVCSIKSLNVTSWTGGVGVDVGVAVKVGVTVNVLVGVNVGVAVGVIVDVFVGVIVGVAVGVTVGV